ncbi:uncharacterized protein O3C94_006605 [Discoglossus pictus]
MHKFQVLQERLSDRTKTKMDDKKLNQTTRLHLFLKTVNPRTGDILPHLLTKMNRINRSLDPVVHPTTWFTDLKTQCKELIGEHNKDINNIMLKLSSFHAVNFSTLPHAKEKLCLLTLSLPVVRLVRAAVQEALHFIMDSILHHPTRQIKSWYQYKKIQYQNIV